MQDDWKLGRAQVEALVAAVEGCYRAGNPYHNATHAADVVQTTWLFLRSAAERVPFTRLEVGTAPGSRAMSYIPPIGALNVHVRSATGSGGLNSVTDSTAT